MRKQQEKIIEKAIKYKFSDKQIAVLSREDLTIQELQIVLNYFYRKPEEISKDTFAEEAEKWIIFLNEKKDVIKNHKDYVMLLRNFLPDSYFDNDTLISSKKKLRIFKMYLFLIKRINEDNISWMCNRYSYMLYKGYSWYGINILLHKMISKEFSSFSFFIRYPYLEDDFIHNDKNSLFYYLLNNIYPIESFEPTDIILNSLYDFENHRFIFSNDEFNNYFIPKSFSDRATIHNFDLRQLGVETVYVENLEYIENKMLEKHTLMNNIFEFCTENNLKPLSYQKSKFTTWQIWKLNHPEEIETINKCYDILGHSFITDIPGYYLFVDFSSNGFIKIFYSEFNSICVGIDNDNGWKPVNKYPYVINIMITPDNRLFKKSSKGKYIPLSMKDFISFYMKQNLFGNLMSIIRDFHQNANVFYKDVISDCFKTKCLLPLTFNEISEYHNRAELIHAKYKKSEEIQIDWNKQNINLSYFIIKSYTCVEPGISRRILINQRDIEAVIGIKYGRTSLEKTYEYLKQVIYKNIVKSETKKLSENRIEEIKKKYMQELKDELKTDVLSDEQQSWLDERVQEELNINDLKQLVSDYVNMCRRTKRKVRLDIRSVNQMKNLHDAIATNRESYRKKTGIVKIPKNSKFLPLRDILSEDFEWIKTRKRLILETELQHHCVWSYADLITKDICAIYSFVDNRAEHTQDGIAKRYTIEFREKKGKFYINQVQGKYDRVHTEDMKNYIQSILDEKQK